MWLYGSPFYLWPCDVKPSILVGEGNKKKIKVSFLIKNKLSLNKHDYSEQLIGPLSFVADYTIQDSTRPKQS